MNKNLSKCSIGFFRGVDMHTSTPKYEDPNYWNYHDCDEGLVKDDALYKVWYEYHDASDPEDFTTWHNVYYFEEYPQALLKMKKKIEDYEKSKDPQAIEVKNIKILI